MSRGRIFRYDTRRDRVFEVLSTSRRSGRKYPYWSDQFSCHPSQLEELDRMHREEGLSADIRREDGCVRVESRGHFKQLLKAHGLRDFSGYD